MKNTLAGLVLFASFSAQASNYWCAARLQTADGKVHKTIVNFGGAQRLAKSLDLYFNGEEYFGQTPTPIFFAIRDSKTKTLIEAIPFQMTYDFKWHIHRKTKYGPLTVDCN